MISIICAGRITCCSEDGWPCHECCGLALHKACIVVCSTRGRHARSTAAFCRTSSCEEGKQLPHSWIGPNHMHY